MNRAWRVFSKIVFFSGAVVGLVFFVSACSDDSANDTELAESDTTEEAEPLWGMDADDGRGVLDTALEGVTASVPGFLVYPSPDGRHAFSWVDLPTAEKLDFETDNHLVDLQTGQSIGAIAEEDGDFQNRNHGGMRVLWRDDSRAFVFRLEGKWAPREVGVVEIGPDGALRQRSLVFAVARAFAALLGREAPDFWDKAFDESPSEYLDCNVGCAFSEAGDSLAIQADFQMNPKQLPGQHYAAGWLTGVFDLKTDRLSVEAEEVTEARVVKEEE